MASLQGFEPRTHGLEGRCSIQLSYEPLKNWSGRRDSNSRPSPWQGDALPLSHFRLLLVEGGGFEPTVLTYRARTLSIYSCIFLGSWGEVQTFTLYSTGVKVLRVYQFHHPAIIPYPKTLFISEVKPIWYSPILAARFS